MKSRFNIEVTTADVLRTQVQAALGADFSWQGFFTYFYE
jgi:hypothetical protein